MNCCTLHLVIRVELVLGLLVFVLWLFSLLEVVRSDDGAVRHLPKLVWLLVVLLFPLVGSIAWLAAGRPVGAPRTGHLERAAPAYPEYDRPGRAAASTPEADEAFLRKVRERAEAQRRAYREQQRGREHQEGGGSEPS